MAGPPLPQQLPALAAPAPTPPPSVPVWLCAVRTRAALARSLLPGRPHCGGRRGRRAPPPPPAPVCRGSPRPQSAARRPPPSAPHPGLNLPPRATAAHHPTTVGRPVPSENSGNGPSSRSVNPLLVRTGTPSSAAVRSASDRSARPTTNARAANRARRTPAWCANDLPARSTARVSEYDRKRRGLPRARPGGGTPTVWPDVPGLLAQMRDVAAARVGCRGHPRHPLQGGLPASRQRVALPQRGMSTWTPTAAA